MEGWGRMELLFEVASMLPTRLVCILLLQCIVTCCLGSYARSLMLVYFAYAFPVMLSPLSSHPITSHLANSAMHPILHGPRSSLLVHPRRRRLLSAQAHLALLDARRPRRERGQIHGIRGHQLLGDLDDIADQAIQQIQTHALAHDDAQDLGLVFFGGEGVVGDDVLLRAEEDGDGFLLDVGVVLLEIVGEAEGDNGETGVVVGGGFAVFLELDLVGVLGCVLAFVAVDVADAGVPSRGFERL